jgi:hypothetical protein
VSALVAVATVASLVLVRCIPHTLPPAMTSEVYKTYAGSDHIECTYFEGYQVNDTLVVPVTLLEAKDSAGWETLVRDFRIPTDMDEETASMHNLVITFFIRKKGKYDEFPDIATDPDNHEFIVLNYKYRRLYVFHTKNEEESDSMFWLMTTLSQQRQNLTENFNIQDNAINNHIERTKL